MNASKGDPKECSILFVLKRSGIAGVETQALRMIEDLHQRGIQVHVLFAFKGFHKEYLERLSKSATIHAGLGILLHRMRRSQIEFDFIYAFELYSLIIASTLARWVYPRARLCTGVYHTLEFCWNDHANFLSRRSSKLLLSFPQPNVFFMNESVRERHQRNLKVKFARSPLAPIGIQPPAPWSQGYSSGLVRIISVGRITDFKTYNFLMIPVIESLIACGLDVQYDIYGDGELKNQLVSQIANSRAAHCIRWHGSLPYQDLHKVFAAADLFVGNGTAVVEAAATGLPCVLAVENEKQPVCFGFFTDPAELHLGEQSDRYKKFSLQDCIQRYTAMSFDEREHLSQAHRQRASQLSISSANDHWLNALNKSVWFQPEYGLLNLIQVTAYLIWVQLRIRLGFLNPLAHRYIEGK